MIVTLITFNIKKMRKMPYLLTIFELMAMRIVISNYHNYTILYLSVSLLLSLSSSILLLSISLNLSHILSLSIHILLLLLYIRINRMCFILYFYSYYYFITLTIITVLFYYTMSATVAAPTNVCSYCNRSMCLRLVSNCMSLPMFFIPFLTKQRLLIEISIYSLFPFPLLHLLGVANLYTVFFLCHITLPTRESLVGERNQLITWSWEQELLGSITERESEHGPILWLVRIILAPMVTWSIGISFLLELSISQYIHFFHWPSPFLFLWYHRVSKRE